MTLLAHTCIPHAAWIPRPHGDPADGLLGLAAVRYYRFDEMVRVDRFRLCPTALRFQPTAYTRPEHLTIARFVEGHGWETLADVHLPVIAPEAWHDIALDGVVTDHLRVVCDWEHPAEACHGDFSYAPWNVPFCILEQVEFLGEPLYEARREPSYEPVLQMQAIAPSAPVGMTCTATPHEVRFRGPSFHVGFSLLRPLITHLAWDSPGTGLVDRSLTCLDSRLARRLQCWPTDLVCGPWFTGLQEEASCLYWGGNVSVEGNGVRYRDLRAIAGVSLDIEFVVEATGMDIHLHQRVERDLVAPEYEAWRFYWNAEEAITATLARMASETGRGGPVRLPALWNAPGHGALKIVQVAGDPVLLQVDSVRQERHGMAGFMLGVEHDAYGCLTIPARESQASLALRTCEVLPAVSAGVSANALPAGLRRHWVTPMAFRPEQGGFSSNAMSSGGLMCMEVLDLCVATALPEHAPPLLEMARYTIRLALQGGPGYGEQRDLFQDTDLALISAAGRLHQAAPNREWLLTVLPAIVESVRRVLGKIDEHDLYLCRALSGNAGSGGWSCNLWDVVSFGHYDAYGNAFCYRALRNAAALLADAGDAGLATRCRGAVENMKAAYVPCFFNSTFDKMKRRTSGKLRSLSVVDTAGESHWFWGASAFGLATARFSIERN